MRNQIKPPLGRLWLAGLALVLLLPSPAAQAQSSITNGLVAYWNFDGKNFNDSVGQFDGTGNGTAPISFVAGKTGFGQAIQLDGVDEFVEITGRDASYNADDLAFAGGSVSIAGWFTVGTFDKSWQALVAKGEGSNWRVARNNASTAMSYAGGLTDALGVTDVTDGNWHHFVAISDAAGANFGTAIYIDGAQDGTIAGNAALVANGSNMKIGDNPGAAGRYWNGKVDDFAIWNRVLTEAEIKTLYNGGTGTPVSSFFAPIVDSDHDGIPDSWDIKYGLNPNDASNASKDLTGDGLTTLQKYTLGLDPTNTTKPTLTSVAASATFDQVALTFSKTIYTGSTIAGDPRDSTIATNLGNYSISPALAITNVTVNGNIVTLATAKQTPGATAYTVTVNNVRDVDNWPVAPNTKATFYSFLTVKTAISSGLQAYWNFDAKNFKDSVNSFDGIGVGSNPVAFTAGKNGFGQALLLDGTDQFVEITGGHPDDLAFAGGSVSIAGWFRADTFDKAWQALVAKGEGSNWRVARNNTNPTLTYAGGLTDALGAKDVSDAGWHHFAAISDAYGANFGTALYIDGAQDGMISGKAALVKNGKWMMIGDNPDARGRYWTGAIDDLAIWNRVLTESEITALYNGGTGKPLSALLSTTTTDALVPPDGTFLTQTPAPNANKVLPNTDIVLVHSDGKTPWTSANVTMKFDGAAVTPAFTKLGNDATIKFTPSAPLASQSTHAVSIGYVDAGGQPATLEWSFTVNTYAGLTKDVVKGYSSLILGKAQFTPDAGGHTGKAGDYAIDLGKAGSAWVDINDATFLNAATANDELTFAIWVKKYDIAAGSAFWAASATDVRGFQAHTPWSDDNIYFDTAGTAATCCDTALNRISGAISTFSGYSGDDSWWTNWHHFTFTKKADQKNIYIDGKLFLNGSSTAPLLGDFTEIGLGTDGVPGGDYMHGIIDDFAVFSNALSASDAAALAGGTSPKDLASSKLIAYWDFNDAKVTPPVGAKIAIVAAGGGKVTVTFTGTLQSATAITGPWNDVAGASSPSTVQATAPQTYYRSKQ